MPNNDLNLPGKNPVEGIKGKIEEKIAAAVDGIKDAVKFGESYGTSMCFRRGVNKMYNVIVATDPTSSKVTDTSKLVIRAAFRVWREKLNEAQVLYASCLRTEQAQTLNTNVGQKNPNNLLFVFNDTDDYSSPFDRRLDKLLVSDQANGPFTVIPFDDRYKDSTTSGFFMNESKIRNSQIENQDEIALAVSAKQAEAKNDPFFLGTPSLVNSYSLTRLYGSEGGKFLVNQKGKRKYYEIDTSQDGKLAYSLNPTTTSIINWGEGDPYGRTPYHFSDFVFCKYWNLIENNRMITLRRYPAPIVDNLQFPGMDGFSDPGKAGAKTDDESTSSNGGVGTNSEEQGSGKKIDFPPMATAITYFGEETGNQLSDILKFTTGLNWSEVESDVFEVGTESTPDMESGPAGLFGGLGSMAKMLNIATGNFDTNAILNQGNLPPDPYANGPYENRIIGPVNAITKVKKRERGLIYENKISLTFEYVARPIGGVNTKAALLDIISNFLVIGSASAMFWGGQHRFMGQPIKYPFIGGDKGIQQWYRGDPLGWGESAVEGFTNKIIGSGGLIDGIKNFFSSLLGGGNGDFMGGIKNIMSGDNVAANVIRAKVAEKSKGQIPYLTGLRALLIGEPVGEWHITIGNPLNPIAMIGNLVCENIEVEFGNELGPDDFPLEVKIIVNLEHGMPRDRDAIQSMFNRGMGRIYDLPDKMSGSADQETKVDNKTGNAGLTGRRGDDLRQGAVIGNSSTTGGRTSGGKTVENALHGNTSVWNRESFYSEFANQSLDFTNPDNLMARSEFRASSWVSRKSLE